MREYPTGSSTLSNTAASQASSASSEIVRETHLARGTEILVSIAFAGRAAQRPITAV